MLCGPRSTSEPAALLPSPIRSIQPAIQPPEPDRQAASQPPRYLYCMGSYLLERRILVGSYAAMCHVRVRGRHVLSHVGSETCYKYYLYDYSCTFTCTLGTQ